MRNTGHWGRHALLVLLAMLAGVLAGVPQGSAQMGKLKIKVSPKQAYLFVDGKAIRDGSRTLALVAGQHEITVENYGYSPQMQEVNIMAGQTTPLDVTLQKSGDVVSGPFGDIEFKGHPRAAVLLNGDTPAFFVGHVDEFDNNFLWHQWLLVKPGTYQATITQAGQTIWSGAIPVAAGQRVIVDLNHGGRMRVKTFKAGLTMKPQPRFGAGIASARVDVAQPTARLAASPTQTNAGQSASLSWTTSDAVETAISNVGPVPASGDRTVSPCQTTTYQLTAKGPGGVLTPSAMIDVNAQPTATLSLSETNVTYHRVGDKVVEQGSATLSWTTSNASSVAIQPLGGVAASGSESIQAAPGQDNVGPVNRDVTYTLQASNACGGTVTRTATLHIGGSINPAPVAPSMTLASIFYPSNYPSTKHQDIGLIPSEKAALAKAAAEFKQYSQFPGEEVSELRIVGHADIRGPKGYNVDLSERRVELVKEYLISQGVPADKIKVEAEGQQNQLDPKQVELLQAQDPQAAQAWMNAKSGAKRATWMAYNRRADIVLEPAGQESDRAYPNDAPDVRLLWQRAQPSVAQLNGPIAKKKNKAAKGS